VDESIREKCVKPEKERKQKTEAKVENQLVEEVEAEIDKEDEDSGRGASEAISHPVEGSQEASVTSEATTSTGENTYGSRSLSASQEDLPLDEPTKELGQQSSMTIGSTLSLDSATSARIKALEEELNLLDRLR